MNKALVLNTVHRLLSRPVTLLVLIAYGFYVLISQLISQSGFQNDAMSSAGAAWFLTWALGSGLLGNDRSEGYLPLLLSRPISRAQYVLSRWLGLLLCVLTVDLALHFLVFLFNLSSQPTPSGQMPLNFGWTLFLQRWLWFAYYATLTAAWISLLSALFSGHGDLLYFIGASLALLFLGGKLGSENAPAVILKALAWFWKPGDATYQAWIGQDHAGAAYTALIFVAAAGLSLAAAAYVMQRCDVSYVNR